MRVTWQCEIDPFCRAVLKHHWPHVPCYEDITALADSLESGLEGCGEREVREGTAPGSSPPARVDVLAGGFPCQPVSLAGKGLAQKDPRWLWPEFARVVGLIRPRYVIVENVPGLVRRGLSDVVGDLAAMGYDAEWQIVSAASVGAPHLRERLILVAYPGSTGRREDSRSSHAHEGDEDGVSSQEDHQSDRHGQGDRAGQVPGTVAGRTYVEDADVKPSLQWRPPVALKEEGGWAWADSSGRGVRDQRAWESESEVGRVADGVPNRVAQLRALGNAVVPQVAEFVGRLIAESM